MKTLIKQPVLLVGRGVDCPDIEYASGFRPVDPVVLLCVDAKRRWLVVPELEHGRAVRQAPGVNVLTPRNLGLAAKQRRDMAGWAFGVLKKAGIRRATVAGRFPLGVARALQRHGIRLDLAAAPLFAQRAIKTPEECRRIGEAQQAAVIAMRAAIAAIAESDVSANGRLVRSGRHLTSESVRATIMKSLLDRGCLCRDPIVAGGEQAADPHEVGHGPLRAHETIVLDIFPQHLETGYWGDLTRTVVKGKATPRVRRMYLAVRAAQVEALRRVRAGVRCETVHRAAEETLEDRGFPRREENGRTVGFIHGTGHGVGLDIHEAPSVSANAVRLRKGNVVTIEPGLYYPGLGGIRIEDTVVVTADGWRYFAPCEKRLEV